MNSFFYKKTCLAVAGLFLSIGSLAVDTKSSTAEFSVAKPLDADVLFVQPSEEEPKQPDFVIDHFSIAAQTGDVYYLTKAFAAGANPNQNLYDGNTPVHAAARHNYTHALKMTLGAGGQASRINDQGQTPLMLAALGGYGEIGLLLAEKTKKKIHQKDRLGRNALHYAAMSKRPDMLLIQSLLAAGIQPNDTDNNGQSPLHYAMFSLHYPTVKLLMAKGGDVMLKDKLDFTPFNMAEKSYSLKHEAWLKPIAVDNDIHSFLNPAYHDHPR